jgi:hypothetical protein
MVLLGNETSNFWPVTQIGTELKVTQPDFLEGIENVHPKKPVGNCTYRLSG